MTSARPNRPVRGGLLVAICASAVALVAAAVAAGGPAERERAEYAWPPATLPAETPSRGWYAPLPLLNRAADEIRIDLPCGLSPPLVEEGRPIVIATARAADEPAALRVQLAGETLAIGLGQARIATVPWPDSCPLRLEVRDGDVVLPSGTRPLQTGAPGQMPIVTGLFSELDLRAGESPQVVVRTWAYATSWTTAQTIAGIVAAVLGCLALVVLVRPAQARLRPREQLGAAWAARDVADAVVIGVLLVWWVVAPVFTDDGWLWVTHRVYDDLGAVASYYDNWGVSSPLGVGPDWLRHWVLGSTNDLLVARLPTLLVLLLCWPFCRFCLERAAPAPAAAARWALAGTFLLGAAAWGMTLRLEPLIALLALVSLAAMLAFSRAPRAAFLVVAAAVAGLAFLTHPVGLIAAAPVLAAGPYVVTWLRHAVRSSRALLALAAGVAAGAAIALVVFALDADVGIRLADARLLREGAFHDEPPWREYVRYTLFDENGADTATRRLSVVFLGLAVLGWLTAQRSARALVSPLPARTVAIGFVLLALVPSKWPWHFAAFMGIGAVAISAEVARLLHVERATRTSLVRSLGSVALIGVGGAWAWFATGQWSSSHELQEAHWRDGFGLTGYGWPLLLLALAGTFAVSMWRAPRNRRDAATTVTIAAWVPAVVACTVVAVTIGVLVYDAVVAPWTVARQNVEALTGDEDRCGLAEQLNLDEAAEAGGATLLGPSVAAFFPCERVPSVAGGLVEVPERVVYRKEPWPLTERDGPFAGVADLYELRNVEHGPRDLEVLAVIDEIPGYARAEADRSAPS